MSYKIKERNTEYLRQWKRNHRETGLCTYCTQAALAGLTMCKYHRDYFRDYKKKRRCHLRSA